jgi:hypothetical protein
MDTGVINIDSEILGGTPFFLELESQLKTFSII